MYSSNTSLPKTYTLYFDLSTKSANNIYIYFDLSIKIMYMYFRLKYEKYVYIYFDLSTTYTSTTLSRKYIYAKNVRSQRST